MGWQLSLSMTNLSRAILAIDNLLDLLEEEEDGVSAVVGTFARQARYLEQGTSPHGGGEGGDMFLQRMRSWAEAKGKSESDMFAIMNAIKKHGTEPRPWYRKVVRQFADDREGLELQESNLLSSEQPVTILVSPGESDKSPMEWAEELQSLLRASAEISTGGDTKGDLVDSIQVAESMEELKQKSLSKLPPEDHPSATPPVGS